MAAINPTSCFKYSSGIMRYNFGYVSEESSTTSIKPRRNEMGNLYVKGKVSHAYINDNSNNLYIIFHSKIKDRASNYKNNETKFITDDLDRIYDLLKKLTDNPLSFPKILIEYDIEGEHRIIKFITLR